MSIFWSMLGWYSIAYVKIRWHDPKTRCHGWVWAAWWGEKPAGKPWRTPDAFGVVEQVWGTEGWLKRSGLANVLADDAIRKAIGEQSRTFWLQDDNLARAAYREHLGQPPRYVEPRLTKYTYAPPQGHDRPPDEPARVFFARCWAQEEETARLHNEAAEAAARGDWSLWRSRTSRDGGALSKLGLSATATEADVIKAFRKRCLTEHPDQGGSAERFGALVALRDAALIAVRAR